MAWLFGGPLASTGELVWGTQPWLIGVAAVISAVAVAVALKRPGAGRGIEAIGLLGAAVVLLWALGDPFWFEASGRTEPGRTVVIIDGSRSMGVDEAGQPRGEKALAILGEFGREVDVFTFGDGLQAGPPTDWSEANTNIGGALAAVADRYLGQSLASVILMSDGVDRGGLRAALAAGGDAKLIGVPELPGPLTVIQVGDAVVGVDLAVTDVSTGGFAFLRTPFFIDASVSGPANTAVDVTLRREGRLLKTRNVQLDDEGKGSLRFEVVPSAVGRFVWEVSVPGHALDAVPGNNTFAVVVRVVRDRTRVLQVCGSPSTDQKFLRLFLKEDPSIDLVSFFILRTHQDFASGWYPDELSLIAFPYERLFTEQLETFDVVIFQNFDFKPYFDRDPLGLLDNIARFVRAGGAFVMIGGDRSFDLGAYADTPISEILPVKLGVEAPSTDEGRFRPVLPERGRRHPVTRIAGNGAESAQAWSRLVELDGLNRNRGLVKGAAALLEHPRLKVAGAPMPVLAVGEVGRGRTMAFMSDASWRWSFSEAAKGHGNQAYLRFWRGALRWLVADPDDRRVVVAPSSDNVLLGEEIRITTTLRDAGFNPIDGGRVMGTVTGPDGVQMPIEATTDAAGLAVVMVRPTVSGAHRVRMRSEGRGTAETVFSVITRDPELAEVSPDAEFLKALAGAYGDRGVYRAPSDAPTPLVDSSARRVVDEQRVVSLSSVPIVGLLFGLFSGLAWWVRRQNGGR